MTGSAPASPPTPTPPAPPVERHLDAVRRRHRRAVRLKVLAVVAAVAVLAVLPSGVMAALDRGAPEPAPPSYAGVAGTYQVIVRTGGETRSMTGTWTVTLGTDGSIALVPPPALDGLTGDGETYSMSSRTFTTNVLIGWPGCQSTALTVGTYRVDVTDRGASFTRVADDCPARITLFGGGLGAAAVTAGRRRATAALGALTVRVARPRRVHRRRLGPRRRHG